MLYELRRHNTEGGHNDISIIVILGEAWFFQNRNGPWFPTLRILHRCEWMGSFIYIHVKI
jgi:predicted ribosome-associated RNA-binding protein Tma20